MTHPISPETFVRITDYIPDIKVDLRYATENNLTGHVIYSFHEAWLRYGTVCKLAKAQKIFMEKGYSLLILDAFRPVAAQFKLWEVFPNPTFVANPEKGFSPHSRGLAVDVTLVTPDGTQLEMPTEFDECSPLSGRDYSIVPEPAASNARFMEQVMSDCGFKPYSEEWWHFSDSDDYPVAKDFSPEEKER